MGQRELTPAQRGVTDEDEAREVGEMGMPRDESNVNAFELTLFFAKALDGRRVVW